MKRSHLKRKRDKPRNSKGLFPHRKKESKAEEWLRIKKDILFPYFTSIGLLDTCELRLPDCLGRALTMQFAHSKKREDIAKQEPERTRELCEVIRVCTNCHEKIEYISKEEGGKEKMYIIVLATIEKRNIRLARWKKVTA